ncbi:MAG: sigma-70 family RNA polymerase sigma factor, partial [Defluviitaleaceae bacterium]|nr:sigma-70 family RNA polymerase sigma factor [Defluviitaleaceae bacterium]
AFRKAADLRADTLLAYLRKIAIHECFRKRNTPYRQQEVLATTDQVLINQKELDEDFLPEKSLHNAERRRELLDAVESLPKSQHEMIYLYFFADFSVAEVAKLMKCTPHNVRQTLYVAKKTLKAKLESKYKGERALAVVPLAGLFAAQEQAFAATYTPAQSAYALISQSYGLGRLVAAIKANGYVAGLAAAGVLTAGLVAIGLYMASTTTQSMHEAYHENTGAPAPYIPQTATPESAAAEDMPTPAASGETPPTTPRPTANDAAPTPQPITEPPTEPTQYILAVPDEPTSQAPSIAETPDTETPIVEASTIETPITEIPMAEVDPPEPAQPEPDPPTDAPTQPTAGPAEAPTPTPPPPLPAASDPPSVPQADPTDIYEPEPELEPEPTPTPPDRTQEILAALAAANNSGDVAGIINHYGFAFVRPITSSTGETMRFYVINEGSGDILVGTEVQADGTGWRMRFKHYENDVMPINILDLLDFMEG